MDKCPFCGEPSINTDNSIKCENKECWEAVVKMVIAESKNIGNSPNDPVIMRCRVCKSICSVGYNQQFCPSCEEWFDDYTYQAGKWYFHNAGSGYVIQYDDSFASKWGEFVKLDTDMVEQIRKTNDKSRDV